MGKKKDKPRKGKDKTERKTAKAVEKRARREKEKAAANEEDDIDAILAKIKAEDEKKVAVHIEDNVPVPSPRCNCSVTANPQKDTEMIVFGGEFYNGNKTFVYGDLYRYSADKGEWRLVSSPNSPPPRSAHQAVAWKNYLFIFGGEFTSPNQERFHHYKDLWRLDLTTNVWEQLQLKNSPSPRSGHRMVLYKHKLILFGGFYDTLREVKYYNDLHVFDLNDCKWLSIQQKLGAMWPSPRSAFQMFVHQDEVFLYGGYYKDQEAKSVVHSDMWRLDPRTFEWSKVKKAGSPPGPRAGFSMCVHKKRAILFGGVVDVEDENDDLKSTFLNEMYAFQMDNRRWYPFELRKQKTPKVRGVKAVAAPQQRQARVLESDEEDEREEGTEDVVDPVDGEEEDSGIMDVDVNGGMNGRNTEAVPNSDDCEGGLATNTDCSVLMAETELERKSQMLSLQDRNCKDQAAGHSEGEEELGLEGEKRKGGQVPPTHIITAAAPPAAAAAAAATATAGLQSMPCGRINASLVVRGNTLFLYGGVMEVGEREVTLDDLYSLDLNKLDGWNCIIEPTRPEWLEPSDNDEDEEEDGEGGSDDEESEEEEDEDDLGMASSISTADDVPLATTESAAATLRAIGGGVSRKERMKEMERLRAQLGLADAERTPQAGETLREFFIRTAKYWQLQAYEQTQRMGKELRRDGFELAEARYKELRPVLDELERLEAAQKEEEEESAKASAALKLKSKSRC